MVIQKTAVYKVLAIVLALLLLVGNSERVEAAEDIKSGKFIYGGKEYFYCYITSFEEYFSNGLVMKFTVDNPCYALCFYQDNGDMRTHIFSYSPNIVRWNDLGNNKSVSFKNKNGIYYYTMDPVKSYNLPVSGSIGNASVLLDAFINFMKSDDFDDLLFTPNFETLEIDNLFQLNNFQASIEGDNLVMKWDPFLLPPYKLMQHVYISYQFKQRPEGSAASSNNRRNYLQSDVYSKISDYGLTIPLSDLNISDGYILSSVNAIPYFYIDDDLNNPTMKGNSSFVYFDAEGVSSSPIIVAPDIEIDLPEEDREQNLYYSIQNFFTGFFRNLTNTIKSAIVPNGDDVLALLQEMNDWFSERLGFIWYPFDLAIDIVAAFALGEPDSKFTVPAFTINILGGIKLWDAFEVDLDPVDFLKYVRFFTSTIMCCGTVSLAIRKWDEWIGGEH